MFVCDQVVSLMRFWCLFVYKKMPNNAVMPQCQSQFTPKMKAKVVPRLLSSLVRIDQYNEMRNDKFHGIHVNFRVLCQNSAVVKKWTHLLNNAMNMTLFESPVAHLIVSNNVYSLSMLTAFSKQYLIVCLLWSHNILMFVLEKDVEQYSWFPSMSQSR